MSLLFEDFSQHGDFRTKQRHQKEQSPIKIAQKQMKNAKRQNSYNMTLKQYIESVNLRRKINYRSRSKTNSQKQTQKPRSATNNLLQPPSISKQNSQLNKTINYFLINKEWKSKQQFNLWIDELKQLSRQFILNDQNYLKVVRIIQKLACFVKEEIQAVKKDNLLLQSYLVTQASCWGAEIDNCEQTNHPQDRLSNYLKQLVLKPTTSFESPQKTIQNVQNTNQTIKGCGIKENRKHFTLGNNCHSASQPKRTSQNSERYQSKQHNTQNETFKKTSTCTKRYQNSKKSHPHHLISFQDSTWKETQEKVNRFIQKNSINPIQQGIPSQNLLNLKKKSQTKGKQDDVPRLSLMSRYDLNKATITGNAHQDTFFSEVSTGSELCSVKNISQPLRQSIANRKANDNSEVQIFIIEPDSVRKASREKTNEKIKISQLIEKQIKNTPSSVDKSSKIINIQTPSTLKKNKKKQTLTNSFQNSENFTNNQAALKDQYSCQSKVLRRENILKRYEGYRKQSIQNK